MYRKRKKTGDATLDAAHAFVDDMVNFASVRTPNPLWKAWAIRESFYAGIHYQETGQVLPALFTKITRRPER